MGRQLKYDQARLAVLNVIAEDRLRPGDKLAPERQLISRMNCSMITLRKALESLEREGMLERSVGRGTFPETLRHERQQERQDSVPQCEPSRRSQLSSAPGTGIYAVLFQ